MWGAPSFAPPPAAPGPLVEGQLIKSVLLAQGFGHHLGWLEEGVQKNP